MTESKRSGKKAREHGVLMGCVDYFIRTGKPVGSNTLKEAGFEELSSATIRNYFANLEKQGYLTQQHASGGRIPTATAYRIYAEEHKEDDNAEIKVDLGEETHEIATFLQESAEKLSDLTKCAVFLSAPRFDHDFVMDIKLVPLDIHRCLAVLITDFGVIQTELIRLDVKVTSFLLKKMEGYFHWRMTGHDKPENMSGEEEQTAQNLYNELMVRYIVGYSSFSDEDIYRTGFSKLLGYSDFHETTNLAHTLSLFENIQSLRLLLRETTKKNTLRFWIESDLYPFTHSTPDCSVITIPYTINQQPAGAVGIMGPMRIPYQQLFCYLRAFTSELSQMLTKSVYKFKISFRQPQEGKLYLQKEEHQMLGQSRLKLLEDKRS